VRAGFGGRHPHALLAEEGVLEEERRYAKLSGLKLLEDVLGVVSSVVAADSGVIPPYDEVGAAVVLAADGVKDRLPGPRIAHRRREHRQ
jgi:hypothetical protein